MTTGSQSARWILPQVESIGVSYCNFAVNEIIIVLTCIAIVKLFLHFAKQKPGAPWAMATGWLIAPNLLVTAGHCANDWSHNLGQVKEIKAYIGYHGKDNVKDPSVQFRHGKKIAAPAEWLNGPAMTRDVSFVRLDKPFTGIRPFKFVDTPGKGTLNLGVVGYPSDSSFAWICCKS